MSLKLPDKGQWAFIILVMCLIAYYTGSVAIYFFNHKTPLYIWKHYDSLLLWRVIIDSSIKSEVRFTALPSLLSGALASLAAPAFIIWKLNQKDAPLFGDAKFASDSDLKNQSC